MSSISNNRTFLRSIKILLSQHFKPCYLLNDYKYNCDNLNAFMIGNLKIKWVILQISYICSVSKH